MDNSLLDPTVPGTAADRITGAGPQAARLLALNAVGCLLIAVLLWMLVPAVGSAGFTAVLVHSETIGLVVCLMLIGTRRALASFDRFRPAIFYGLIPPLALIGYYVGSVIAYWLLGNDNPVELTITRGRTQNAALITTGIATLVSTYFFIVRERIGRLRLAAAEEARQVQQAQREVSEAQLSMLRAQVEPHMLFNTLANLRELVVADPPRAQAMLDRLIDFLRATLAGSRSSTTTLGAEFAMLDDYLALMQIRLATRLRFRLDLPGELATRVIPSLMLQPLVENAIVHGIEPSVEGGTVDVVARLDGGVLDLSVTDTGIGTEAAARRRRRRDGEGGFGIEQLRQRLANAYGDDARIEIISPLPGQAGGTRVAIRIDDEATRRA